MGEAGVWEAWLVGDEPGGGSWSPAVASRAPMHRHVDDSSETKRLV